MIGGDLVTVIVTQAVADKRPEVVTGGEWSAGRAFHSTRKREIENYICPEIIFDQTGVRVVFTDTCDEKKPIGQALRVSANDVLDQLRPRMPANQILLRSTYRDGDQDKSEIKDLLRNILALID